MNVVLCYFQRIDLNVMPVPYFSEQLLYPFSNIATENPLPVFRSPRAIASVSGSI